jgi:integrase
MIAREWHEKRRHSWKPEYAELVLHRLVKDAFPWLGERRLADISPRELLLVLRRIEARGAVETAHRILQYTGQILRYGIATGRAERDITSDLRGALRSVKERHHASLTDPKEVGALFSAIQAYKGSFVTRCALQLAALTFVRPGELRKAEWSEIDLDLAEWRIPAERMKMRAKHIVPLSTQAVCILRELQPVTGRGVLVFPGTHNRSRFSYLIKRTKSSWQTSSISAGDRPYRRCRNRFKSPSESKYTLAIRAIASADGSCTLHVTDWCAGACRANQERGGRQVYPYSTARPSPLGPGRYFAGGG